MYFWRLRLNNIVVPTQALVLCISDSERYYDFCMLGMSFGLVHTLSAGDLKRIHCDSELQHPHNDYPAHLLAEEPSIELREEV